MNHLNDIIVAIILAAGMVFSIGRKKLTVPAAITGALLGAAIYAGGGFTGLSMMTVFFILGTAATSWKKNEKRLLPPGNESSIGRPSPTNNSYQPTRHTGQVIANAGVAAIAGVGIVLSPSHASLLQKMMAASLSAAAADTLSSELGMVYGRRFYNILTGRREEKGLDGVISLEGLLFGVAGSAVIALLYVPMNGWNAGFWIILASGTAGNLADSLLGATLERRHLISNDVVNFLNTLFAALMAATLTNWFL
jgi:uncharacterized protein (TIGR00297 family)